MGSVYRARHKSMDRVVALKVLRRRDDLSAEMLKRFKREILAAAKLTHPNIVTAFDAGEQRGIHYLVMEYVSGGDLQSRLTREGPLSVADAVSYVQQVAVGMQYAHEQKIVHRDIKPANLLLSTDGYVKILDLGLAKLLSDQAQELAAASELTADGTLMGTVDFISPEQSLDTKLADARSDIYSLGCTLYTLLTGRPVYPLGTVVQKILAHREGPIPRLRDLRPDVPESLEDLVRAMLAKSPLDRPATMGLVAERLRTLQSNESLADQPARIGTTTQSSQVPNDTQTEAAAETLDYSQKLELTAPTTAPPLVSTLPTTGRSAIKRRKNQRVWWVVGAALLVVGIVTLAVSANWWTGSDAAAATSRLTLIFQTTDLGAIAGAEIWIDQELRGRIQQSRQEFDLLGDSNVRDIQVRHPGYETFVHNIAVNPATVTELPVQLRQLPAVLPTVDQNATNGVTPAPADTTPLIAADASRSELPSTEISNDDPTGSLATLATEASSGADASMADPADTTSANRESPNESDEPGKSRTLIVGVGDGKIANLATAIQQANPNDTILIEHQGPLELSPLDLTGKTPLTIEGGTQGGLDFWPIIRQQAYSGDALNRILARDDNTAQPLFSGDQLELHFKKIHLSVGGYGREKLNSIFRCNSGKISFEQCTVTASTDEAMRFSEGVELPLVQLAGSGTQHLDLRFMSTLIRGARLRSMVRVAADASVTIEGQQLLWAGGQGSVIQIGYGTSQARLSLQNSTLYNFKSLLEIPPDRLLQNRADRVMELQLDQAILMGRDRGESALVSVSRAENPSFDPERWRRLINLSADKSIIANIDNWLPDRDGSSKFKLAEFINLFRLEKAALQDISPRFRVLPAGVELQEVQPRDLEMRVDRSVKATRELLSPPGARAANLPPALSLAAERVLVPDVVAGKPREPRQVIEVSQKDGPIRTLEEAFRQIQGEDVEIVLTDSETYVPGRNFDIDNKSAILYTEVPRYLTLRAADDQTPVIVISDSPRLQVGNIPALRMWRANGPQLFLFQIRTQSWHLDGIRFTTDIVRDIPRGVFLTSARYLRITNCSIIDRSAQMPAFFEGCNGYGVVTRFDVNSTASERSIDGPLLSWIENFEIDHLTPRVDQPRDGFGALPTLFPFTLVQHKSAHHVFRNCRTQANHTLMLNSLQSWIEIEGCSILGRLISSTESPKLIRIHENLIFALPQPVWTQPDGLVDSVVVSGGGNALVFGGLPVPVADRNQGPFRCIPGPALNRAPELDDKGRIKGRLQAGATMAEDGGPVGFRPERVAR